MKTLSLIRTLCGLFLLGMIATGCGSVAIDVVQYPSFWSDNQTYESIQVAPVENNFERGVMEGAVASQIVAGLVENGAYTVYDHTRDYLNQLPAEAELGVYSDIIDYAHYPHQETRYREEQRPVYLLDAQGWPVRNPDGTPVIDHFETERIPYPWFSETAYANMNVEVYRLSDNAVLLSKKIQNYCEDEGAAPHEMLPPQELIQCAIMKLPYSVVSLVAPHWQRIYVDAEDMLRITRQGKKGWEMTNSFNWSDPQVRIRLSFPDEARMNTFKMEIVPAGKQDAIHAETFTWQAEYPAIEYIYDMQDFSAMNHSDGKFTVRLWTGTNMFYEQHFRIK